MYSNFGASVEKNYPLYSAVDLPWDFILWLMARSDVKDNIDHRQSSFYTSRGNTVTLISSKSMK